jgi:uncharacterized protein (TIGR00730 family)
MSVKAYKNLEFLNSPDARIIRMLSEFVEPQSRFRRGGVRNTIVFFGSARTLAPRHARARLAAVEKRMPRRRKPGRKQLAELEDAKRLVNMSRYYADCVTLSRLLTEWAIGSDGKQRFLVCSGGGPGIMEAANKGARLAGGKSVGLNISLPFEQSANQFISREFDLEFHYFFMRKFWFVYLAKALVVFPGGFGTMDELMEVLTLLQTNKIKKKVNVIIYGSDFWKRVLDFDFLVEQGVISPDDLKLFSFMDDPYQAFESLRLSLTRNYPEKR